MKTITANAVEKTVYEMLKENTGKALCDSGDAYGRNWQRNADKTIAHFKKQPSVTWNGDYYTISVFHYLVGALEVNQLCEHFNAKFVPAKDWDGDIDAYGISADGAEWIKDQGFQVERTFNSYNGDSALSQVIQGTWLKLDGDAYLLLQIHQGCDVRGGYTDARLFRVPEECAMCEDVLGTVTKANGERIKVSNLYDGFHLKDENDQDVKIEDGDKVDLSLSTI